MSFLPRILRRFNHCTPLKPRVFPTSRAPWLIDQTIKIEEETIPGYVATQYYPVQIGEVLADRYQVVGKLGFGQHSTAWLARDLNQHGHVALKVCLHSEALRRHPSNEIAMYERMAQRAPRHLGRIAVRTLLDSFKITGPDGEHLCLVHPPLGESVAAAVGRSNPQMLTPFGIRYVLVRLLLALAYLHKECQIIHTDIRADHIMFSIGDPSILTDFEEEEIRKPSPRKKADGRTIYGTRLIRDNSGELGPPVLCDFGSAVFGDEDNYKCVQPHGYRSPEVILGASWDYKIDIWNVGCMIWDIFQQRYLFEGIDPEHREYRRRAHLAEIIALLGLPPKDLLARGSLTSQFFSLEGQFIGGIDLPAPTSLEAVAIYLTGEEKRRFLEFVRKMLNWDPAQRSTAGQLLRDPWLNCAFF
ncbi:kinase domain protein [Nemania sp. FL0031]|nr:kinase domain protein [Nemania sp. FL0031]